MPEDLWKIDTEAKAHWDLILNEKGVNLAELRANLVMSPEQRLRKAEAARQQLLRQPASARRKDPAEEAAESLHILLAIQQLREEAKRRAKTNQKEQDQE